MAPAPAQASETVKRAPTMDMVEEEGAIVPSPMKKQKVEDAEDDGGNSIDSGSSDEEMPDTESEWGVDSYDELEYESNPVDREYFAEDEEAYKKFKLYRTELLKGKGFIPDKFNGIHPLHDVTRGLSFIHLCIDKYNRETGKTLEYVSTVKGNVRRGAKFVYYMTIMAREVPDGPLVEYQVKALYYVGGGIPGIPILCRPSPNPGT